MPPCQKPLAAPWKCTRSVTGIFIIGFIFFKGFVGNNKYTDKLPYSSVRSVSALISTPWIGLHHSHTVGVWVSVKFNYSVFFQLCLWLYLNLHPQVVWPILGDTTCCIVLMMSYFICRTSQQVFVYCCVSMPMILWWVGAYAFTQCMKIVIVFPVIASSCFRTTQTKRCVALPASLFRHKHRFPLGNRHCAHSLTEISRRKQAWPQGIMEGENKRMKCLAASFSTSFLKWS